MTRGWNPLLDPLNYYCEPGLRCDAARHMDGWSDPKEDGNCVEGQEGSLCRDGRECPAGLLCGSSKKCVKTAEGEPCQSNFVCPADMQCSKATLRCTAGVVPSELRFPPMTRMPQCKLTTDCGGLAACINGVCLPARLGDPCDNGSRREPCIDGVANEGIEGQQCTYPGNCFIGMTCRGGQCAPSNTGDKCRHHYNCPPPARCNEDEICVRPGRGEVCENSVQCTDGLQCLQLNGKGLCSKPSPDAPSACNANGPTETPTPTVSPTPTGTHPLR